MQELDSELIKYHQSYQFRFSALEIFWNEARNKLAGRFMLIILFPEPFS